MTLRNHNRLVEISDGRIGFYLISPKGRSKRPIRPALEAPAKERIKLGIEFLKTGRVPELN